MNKLLSFDHMVTPKIITAIYYLAIIAFVIAGFVTMFSGYGGISFFKFLTGLAIMVGGWLGARIYCELLIVLFKINENLKKVAENVTQ